MKDGGGFPSKMSIRMKGGGDGGGCTGGSNGGGRCGGVGGDCGGSDGGGVVGGCGGGGKGGSEGSGDGASGGSEGGGASGGGGGGAGDHPTTMRALCLMTANEASVRFSREAAEATQRSHTIWQKQCIHKRMSDKRRSRHTTTS